MTREGDVSRSLGFFSPSASFLIRRPLDQAARNRVVTHPSLSRSLTFRAAAFCVVQHAGKGLATQTCPPYLTFTEIPYLQFYQLAAPISTLSVERNQPVR